MTAAVDHLSAVRALRADLWSRGYRPVPVYTRQKRPSGLGWQDAARANPPAAARMPVTPNAASTGILCDGLRALDIDVEDHERAADIEAMARDLLGATMIRERSDSAKRLLLYRAAAGEPKKLSIVSAVHKNKDDQFEKVEALGRGQQFVAWGIHPDGQPYAWRDETPLSVARDDLPAVSEDEITAFLQVCRDIIGAREEITEKPISERALATVPARKEITDTSHREAAVVARAMEEEIGRVASAGKGTRNDTLNAAAFNLGQLVGAGWISRGEVEASLSSAAASCGLANREAALTIRSGITAGAAQPRPPLVDREGYQRGDILDPSPLLRGALATVDQDTGEVFEDDDDDDDTEDAAPLDEDLTRVPGLLGELIDWIASVGSTGNRRLALAAALPFLGTLLGRRMATPTGQGGNLELYVIATMGSGGGKASQMKAVARLMQMLNLDNMHWLGNGFSSGSALATYLAGKPLLMCGIDEIADYFEEIINGGAHNREAMSILKQIWGHGFDPFDTKHAASRSTTRIVAPTLSILGLTTNEDLIRVIKGREITSGFINRFMVIDAGPFGNQNPTGDIRNPPQGLLRKLADLYQMGSPKRGNMAGHTVKNDPDPLPVIVPWGSSDAQATWKAFEGSCNDKEADLGPIMGKLYSRVAFMAIKMATIRACCDHSPVTVDHVQWGIEIARQSAEFFVANLRDNMTDAITPAEFFQKIKAQFTSPTAKGEKLMEEYGAAVLPRRFLWRNLQHHTGKSPFDFDNAIKAMTTNGEIAIKPMRNPVTGRTADCIIYRRRIRRITT